MKNEGTLFMDRSVYKTMLRSLNKAVGFDMKLKNILYFDFVNGIAYYPPTISDVDFYIYSYDSNEYKIEEKTANKIQKLELHRYTLARSTTEIFSLLFLCKNSSVVLLLIFWSSRTLTYLFSCGKFDVKK